MKIGIVGSQRRDTATDKQLTFKALFDTLETYQLKLKDIILVSGGCPKGGDRFVEEFAKEFGITIELHLPDKSRLDPILLQKNPRAAYAVINYARNKLIAEASDILIACVASNRKGGTEDTIKHYKKFGKNNLVLC